MTVSSPTKQTEREKSGECDHRIGSGDLGYYKSDETRDYFKCFVCASTVSFSKKETEEHADELIGIRDHPDRECQHNWIVYEGEDAAEVTEYICTICGKKKHNHDWIIYSDGVIRCRFCDVKAPAGTDPTGLEDMR